MSLSIHYYRGAARSATIAQRDECIPREGTFAFENFRPWHVFGLDSTTATTKDVKESFRQLVKTHHPDMGGDARVFERLQKMRDSLIALMN